MLNTERVTHGPQANLVRGATLARRSGQSETLIRAALVADLGVLRVDSLAREHLEVVESALQIADPADTVTYARLLAVLSKSLTFTPEVERRVTLAHRALRLAEQSDDATLLARVAPAVLAALWAPGNERLRNEVAARALSAAEASGDPLLQFSVNLAARHVAIESGDPVMAAHTLNRLRATANSVGEPYLRWLIMASDTFEAMMAGRLVRRRGARRGGARLRPANRRPRCLRHVRRPSSSCSVPSPAVTLNCSLWWNKRLVRILPCSRFGRPTGSSASPWVDVHAARAILHEGMEADSPQLAVDNFWMTSVIAYVIIAIELDDREAAAQLLPVIEPYAVQVSFNGVTSQGPVAAYVGKLASLLGRHDEAERHLRAALATATAFGWTYHRATTLLALAQVRHRRLGALDEESRSWLSESSELCRTHGFQNWIAQIDDLPRQAGGSGIASLIRASCCRRDALMTRARIQDCLQAAGEGLAEVAEEGRRNDDPGHCPRG